MSKAVLLLSGGLDSATLLALAVSEGHACHCLSFDYGQKHATELEYARRLAQTLGAAEHRIARIDAEVFGASALTDAGTPVPDAGASAGVPPTYVPARNTLFLAYGLAWAEALGATSLFIGVNALDYSGYPDCRPEYIAAFEALAKLATKAGAEDGKRLRLRAPLIDMTKGEIIRLGASLGLDYAQTVSCYRLDNQGGACGKCDSCALRKQGFADAGLADPTRYAAP